jgi:hypothetical protein
MNHTLIITENDEDLEMVFPTRSLMLTILGRLVRRNVEVRVKQ